MSRITAHILDTTLGKPAANVVITLFKEDKELWTRIASGFTNIDGRITDLLNNNAIEKGIYKLKFETAAYFSNLETESFYPYIEIIFSIDNEQHYHVPLLLNPFGYSTYRGS